MKSTSQNKVASLALLNWAGWNLQSWREQRIPKCVLWKLLTQLKQAKHNKGQYLHAWQQWQPTFFCIVAAAFLIHLILRVYYIAILFNCQSSVCPEKMFLNRTTFLSLYLPDPWTTIPTIPVRTPVLGWWDLLANTSGEGYWHIEQAIHMYNGGLNFI